VVTQVRQADRNGIVVVLRPAGDSGEDSAGIFDVFDGVSEA
jgi:hypothetical protein